MLSPGVRLGRYEVLSPLGAGGMGEVYRARDTELFIAKMGAHRMGDPLEDGVDVGPQALRDLRDELAQQVATSVAGGARVLLGGTAPPVRAPSIPPPSSPTSARGCRPTTRRCSGPWPR